MLTMIAHILCAQRGVPTHRLLYFQVPFVITWNLHFARIKEIEGGNRTAVGKIGAESGIGPDRLPVQAPCRCGRERTIEKYERRIIRRVGQDVINRTGRNGIAEDTESTADDSVLGAERRPCEADLWLI